MTPSLKRGVAITAEDVRSWIKECAFPTDAAAARTLGVPLRTFGRWKANGIPIKTMQARVMSYALQDRMLLILQRRRDHGQA